jgi:quinol monooxygenase YgiN
MENCALFVRLEARPGMEKAVEEFLNKGMDLAEDEPGTISWYAIRFGPTSFGIFDTFTDEDGRNVHLSGKIAEALKLKSAELFAVTPKIEKVDIIALKKLQHQLS